MPPRSLTWCFRTLQSTVMHSGAIPSAFFAFIFEVAENNTLNGKMKYIPFHGRAISPAPLLPLPTYIHTSFNSNGKYKQRKEGAGENTQHEHFSCFFCNKSLAILPHKDRYHLYMSPHPSQHAPVSCWTSDTLKLNPDQVCCKAARYST